MSPVRPTPAPAPPRRTARSRRNAFSLLELVAMLAVLAILIAVSANALFARVRQARRQEEAADLERIAGLWTPALTRSLSLPSTDQWTEWLATNASPPIQRVAFNASGLRRQAIYDPAARLGLPAAPPPFLQTASGSTTPVHLRLILASGLTEDLPDLRSLDFESLWTNAPGQWPAGWPATWAGEPADLVLARVDFGHRFRRVILQNADRLAEAGYAVQSQPATLPPGDVVDGWFIEGSLLELHAAAGTPPTVQAAERISEDTSFVFERGRWTRPPSDGPSTQDGLGALADRFLEARTPAVSDADQRAVVDEWVAYLNAYAQWSHRGFPTDPPADPSHRAAREAQARLVDAARHLQAP
ncbi:MAG: hypothetical protein KIT22_04880 [Verrucomicrobiae bacterium]|nr:hypothetical protein [Verrucomicrobiae bacterium]